MVPSLLPRFYSSSRMSQDDSDPLRVLNEPSKRGGKRAGAGRPPTKKRRLSKETGVVTDRENGNATLARPSSPTGQRENKRWRHCKTECRDRRKYYEDLRRDIGRRIGKGGRGGKN